jgi:two-component system chemotaxis sensor kinase CheA
MARKKNENIRSRNIANISSAIMFFILCASFILETLLSKLTVSYVMFGFFSSIALIMIVTIIRNEINHYKLGFNIPLVLYIFSTLLMMLSSWNSSYYFLFCFGICVTSCLYFNFYRTIAFIIFQNIAILFLALNGYDISGQNVPLHVVFINWVIFLFSSVLIAILTKAATITLTKALENQNSFKNLLDTTENYIAMINERNEVVYSSKTLSMMGNVEEADFVQGRPLIDLFPGKSLKIFAGKLLSEKDDYAGDWEFSLNGMKRYFKASSHSLPDGSGSTLISLYDMTHLAERDEIAAMKDSLKIGIFFMDQNYIIQDHYSRYLDEMLSQKNLYGKAFTDILSDSVTKGELEAIQDYFNMVMERTYDQEILDDINPLTELHYVNAGTGDRKVLQCAFTTVERGRGEVFILVTIYDITTQVELKKQLAEEEARRQEEMQSVFELIKVEPNVFSDFMEDMEVEFDNIEKIQKNNDLNAHEVLVKIYQSVHAIKSNAVILGLSVFGNKVHDLESKIKRLREMEEEVPFAEMLNLAMDIEKISKEREGFKEIIGKLKSYTGDGGGNKQNVKVLVDSIAKAASKAAEDMERQVKFIANEIDSEAIDIGPRRIMKDILMQLVRNSVVHGIEVPDIRKSKGKNETGVVKLSIKMTEDKRHIHMIFSDDGRGLDYPKIAERAIENKLIKKEDENNKDALMKAIFAPGFSTAETEGLHAGRGIGLNLVMDRVKEVNGNIRLRSENDKGTLFFVSIPVKAQSEKAAG